MRSLLLDDVLMDYVSDPQNWQWMGDRGWFRNVRETHPGVNIPVPLSLPPDLIKRVRGLTLTASGWTAASSQYLGFSFMQLTQTGPISNGSRVGTWVPGHTQATIYVYHGDAGQTTHYSNQLNIPCSVTVPDGEVCTGVTIKSAGFHENGIQYNILSRGLKDITLHF